MAVSILKCPYCSDSIRKSGAYIVGIANGWIQAANIQLQYWYRVNGQISDRAKIQTPNFQLQYLLQLYSKNLTIILQLEPLTGIPRMRWWSSWGSMGRIWADIAFESWLFEFWSCSRFGRLPYNSFGYLPYFWLNPIAVRILSQTT